ncbi:hypothetical protein [Paenibacillus sp.]|uniref:hypothetical protein n=1 Tax=Paenibacillus sp. TaxID=58172 RepID=UPI002D48A8DA|nr:hypothetical protein [Paenibacillus sp.]HZG57601.1 hypothetical protein [Paenibacillus sp.]
MELQNCVRCGGLFLKAKSQYCSECTKWFAETYGTIRDYLRSNPNRTLWDVHVDLNLPLSVVQQVIKYAEENE